jgi:arsenate reductase
MVLVHLSLVPKKTITFEDPKAFDNTPQQAEKYHERSMQIATELFTYSHKLKK